MAACVSSDERVLAGTSFTVPSLAITANSTTVPSIRARPASGGYFGATSWTRLASAIRAGTRILFGVGAGVVVRTGALPLLRNTSLSAPPGIPPTTPPGTPPTSPPAVSTGGEGASCVVCTTMGILIFVGVFLEVNVGTGRLVTLEAAAAGGTYNIVSVSRLGSVSV